MKLSICAPIFLLSVAVEGLSDDMQHTKTILRNLQNYNGGRMKMGKHSKSDGTEIHEMNADIMPEKDNRNNKGDTGKKHRTRFVKDRQGSGNTNK